MGIPYKSYAVVEYVPPNPILLEPAEETNPKPETINPGIPKTVVKQEIPETLPNPTLLKGIFEQSPTIALN